MTKVTFKIEKVLQLMKHQFIESSMAKIKSLSVYLQRFYIQKTPSKKLSVFRRCDQIRRDQEQHRDAAGDKVAFKIEGSITASETSIY